MDKLVDRNLNQMDPMEEAVENQSDSDWLKPWILEIHAEGYKEGYAVGYAAGYAEGYAEGRKESHEEGRAKDHEEALAAIRARLCHQAASKWDPETLGRLTNHLDRISDLEPLLDIHERLSKGETGAELLKCLDDRS